MLRWQIMVSQYTQEDNTYGSKFQPSDQLFTVSLQILLTLRIPKITRNLLLTRPFLDQNIQHLKEKNWTIYLQTFTTMTNQRGLLWYQIMETTRTCRHRKKIVTFTITQTQMIPMKITWTVTWHLTKFRRVIMTMMTPSDVTRDYGHTCNLIRALFAATIQARENM